MKIKNIILMIILAAGVLGIGFFIRPYHTSHAIAVRPVGHLEIWYCPMHPHYTSDHPGQCPICGMTLVKKREEIQKQGFAVDGYTTVVVNTPQQQLVGVKTIVIGKNELVKTIRAAGQYQGEVYAQVFEIDLEFIKIGQKAIVELPAYHQKYEGKIAGIDSSIDETSRTTRVRIWLKHVNQRQLKSNMFVNVELPVNLGEGIIVPREAVLDTGLRKIVFVQKDQGTFEPREIQTGMETDDGFEVKSGLTEGEQIVVSGNFLLDSESRVQAGLL